MFPQPYVAMRLAEQHQHDLIRAATKRHRLAGRPNVDLEGDRGRVATKLRVQLLGPFSVTAGAKAVGPWPRPPAKRLCELVLVSPGRRIGRDAACEELFPNLTPPQAAKALSRALSLARATLSKLGDTAHALLQADRTFIAADFDLVHEVDLEVHEEALRTALRAAPSTERDDLLVLALTRKGTLLEDEPFADWALRPRERLELLRQEARLVLARDRAKGEGRSQPGSVIEAWEDCLAHDPTCEEAATALMRVYAAQRKQVLVECTYKRCRTALEELGVHGSAALEEAYEVTLTTPFPLDRAKKVPPPCREERRLVTVVFAELAGPSGTGRRLGPERVRDLVSGALAEVVGQVESFGGTVTAVTGTGLVAIFGAPEAHEDDPERALRAAFRAVGAASSVAEGVSLHAGVETGPAVVGWIGGNSTGYYGAVGEAVGAAAAFQSAARPGSVLVGTTTRASAEGLFHWGPSEEVPVSTGAKPLRATYLERPKACPSRPARPQGLGGAVPLVGREPELSDLREAIQEATAGRGSVVVITGEPGLGKTRLVDECRTLFMDWVGAAAGRLPLWLEGSAASYTSATPYGLYQRLLSAWVGIAPEESGEVARPALETAVKATFGGNAAGECLDVLSHVMGLTPGKQVPVSSRLGPEQLQQATFDAVGSMVSRLVSHGPTVLVLEDLHWADANSLYLTEGLFSLAEEGPLLIVLTRRPEPDQGAAVLEAALGASPRLRVRKLELALLSEAEERDLARALLGETTDEVVDAVSEGAEGNPLFLETLLASLLETKALVRAEAGWCLERGAPRDLPNVIERLVQSRLDRLGPSRREAVVAASALGPEFTLAAIDAVTDLDSDVALAAVSELCAAGLLVEVRRLPEPTYRFRHALVQEATYQCLLSQQRTRLHARAAWRLEAVSAGRLGEVASLLSYHYALAGEKERAADYLEIAGENATSARARADAIAS